MTCTNPYCWQIRERLALALMELGKVPDPRMIPAGVPMDPREIQRSRTPRFPEVRRLTGEEIDRAVAL